MNIGVEILCGIFLTLQLVMLVIAGIKGNGREIGEEDGEVSSFLIPFIKEASMFITKEKQQTQNSTVIQKNQLLKKQFQMIHPTKNADKQLLFYKRERLAWVFFSATLGSLFALFIAISEEHSTSIIEGNIIQREEYGMGTKELSLIAQYQNQNSNIPFVVEERQYTKEEIDTFAKLLIQELEGLILGDNASLDCIRHDVNLVRQVEGYPFDISWEASSYEILDIDGTVKNKELAEPAIVTVTAILRYQEERVYFPYTLVIQPPIYTEEELLLQQVQTSLKEEDDSSSQRKEMKLPAKLQNGSPIVWREKRAHNSVFIVGITMLVSCSVFFLQEKEVQKKVKKRDQQLMMDYSELIGKLTLYMNAGMTTRNAFAKICDDYVRRAQKKESYLHEEMLLTCHELQTGISEVEAYEHFGKRCRLRQYVRFSALITQNLKKGSNNIIMSLQQESRDAFEYRKKQARKLGEEASTKMLGPMIMMLGVVLVMIMIPAYLSFGM